MNRLRLRMIQSSGKTTDAESYNMNIYFVDNDESNGTKVKEMKINDKGEYVTDEIPDGFFDQPKKTLLKF